MILWRRCNLRFGRIELWTQDATFCTLVGWLAMEMGEDPVAFDRFVFETIRKLYSPIVAPITGVLDVVTHEVLMRIDPGYHDTLGDWRR